MYNKQKKFEIAEQRRKYAAVILSLLLHVFVIAMIASDQDWEELIPDFITELFDSPENIKEEIPVP